MPLPDPLPGGLRFVPLTDEQLDLIREALGCYAGGLADRNGPADYAAVARLQTHLTQGVRP